MSAKEAKRWLCGNFEFDLRSPLVMGILNVTPDSFSDGGQHDGFDAAVTFATTLVNQGADIIDVGGESTRPGAQEVSIQEELRRTVEVVRSLSSRGMCVSIDTRHADVARACVEAGASIVNDVSGFSDPAMRDLAATRNFGCVIMHMAGEPATMQEAPQYVDVVGQVSAYLKAQAAQLEALGVAHDRICLDPGIGFGKTTEHNVALLDATKNLVALGYPVMVATSRKRFIGELYGGETPQKRDWGSVATAVQAICDGARVARVHNVQLTAAALNSLLMPPRRAMVALGSNMGDRVATINGARDAIDALPATDVYAMSSIYESEPAYYEAQPAFANAVLEVQTRLIAPVLLAMLNRIEKDAGRVRLFADGPRTLDLDILDYSSVTSDDPELTLPHPHFDERDFVVTPLLEIAPAFTAADGNHPGYGGVKYGKVTGKLS